MSFWTVVAVASSVGKAYATLYSAAATKASMDAQADISALQFILIYFNFIFLLSNIKKYRYIFM